MSESDEENYGIFGEPLDPLDEENLPRKKAISVEEQYATDSQGRRRFHGAFTGGFSAGYFNSVGTRDGWKPQQFKSSRTSKAQSQLHGQRPEDFMDEEDTNEFGIAPTGIRASSQYSIRGKGIKRKERCTTEKGVIPGIAVLREILEPVHETVGIALLKKMGWKPGQGVGPRLTRKQKNKKTADKVYGCALPDDSEDDDDDDDVLFAPDDYEPFRSNPKDNFFGIGYTGLERRSILGHINLFDDSATFKLQDKEKNLSIRGQAFGVGAFEADDEDIYAREDMSNYDFSLGPEKEKKTRWTSKPIHSSQTVLEGFVPATNLLPEKKHFSLPQVPKDFKPIHTVRKSRFDSSPPKPMTKVDRSINATKRSVIIGEQQVQSKKLSEPSWLNKLKSTSFVHGGVEGPASHPFPEVAKSAAAAATATVDNEKSISIIERQRQHEQEEFKQAPASCKLFVASGTNQVPCSSSTETTTKQQEAAARMKMFGKLTRVIEPWQPSSIVCKRFNIPEPKTTINPSCGQTIKKFSIFESFDQHSSHTFETPEGLPHTRNVSQMSHDETSAICQNSEHISDDFETTYEKVFLGKSCQQEQISSTENKKDLFKAIFLSSSENSDDSEQEEEQAVNDDTVKLLLIGKPTTEIDEVNRQRNSSPARGIFAKIDLDNLIDSTTEIREDTAMRSNDKGEKPHEKEEIILESGVEVCPLVYGPALPVAASGHSENVQKSIFPSVVTPKASVRPSTSHKWVEKRKKYKKNKKKKHKHKEKEKKHKHKEKKK